MQFHLRSLGLAAMAAVLTNCGPSDGPTKTALAAEVTTQVAPAPNQTPTPTPAPAPESTPANLPPAVAMVEDKTWSLWRGPLGMGASVEHYVDGKLASTPSWTYDSHGRGTPVIADGKIFSWGYHGEKDDLVQCLTCLDEATGKKLWEATMRDFISDIIYNRYSIGAPCVDVEAKRVYLMTGYGLFGCWTFDGKEVWKQSMMEKFGRLTFPNNRTGCAFVEGDLVIVRGITSNWGSEGPAADRFYAFDKNTGELVWSSTPGEIPPKDSVFSTPVVETRDGMRVFWSGTGCGNIVAVNARNGKPLWRYKTTKGGINASPLIHKGNKIITVYGEENLDTADKGRMVAIRIPEHFGKEQIVLDPSVDKEAWSKNEIWRLKVREETSSPILAGDHVYLVDDDGLMMSINAETGEQEWTLHITSHNIHSSPLFVDGLIYFSAESGGESNKGAVAPHEGDAPAAPATNDGAAPSESATKTILFVVKPGEKSAEIVNKVKLDGVGLAQPAVLNGKLYVHTTAKFYCFNIDNKGITWDKVPAQVIPKAGPPAALQVIPQEFVVHPGMKQSFRLRSVDAKGFTVADVPKAKWETFIPPTAKVKAKIGDAAFDESNNLVVKADAKSEAGAFKATAEGGIFGTIRGRVLPRPPFVEDFEEFDLAQEHAASAADPVPYKFAFPPLPWTGARFKFDIRDINGSKVLAKNFDRLFFQRATIFMGTEDMHDYTLQADVMTDGNRRGKSDVGVINQRYLILIKGNTDKLEISSNFERFRHEIPFPVKPQQWYTMKTQVDHNADGSGVVKVKVWDKSQPEPEPWTMEAKTDVVHTQGSPGLFAFAFQNLHRVYYDNIKVTPNAAPKPAAAP